LLLGQASGVLDAVIRGTPWVDAALGGLVATALAVLAHDAVIESVLAGREIGAPPKVAPLENPPPGGAS
jgi:hypothetical protein